MIPHLGTTVQHYDLGGVAAATTHSTGSLASVHLVSQLPRSC